MYSKNNSLLIFCSFCPFWTVSPNLCIIHQRLTLLTSTKDDRYRKTENSNLSQIHPPLKLTGALINPINSDLPVALPPRRINFKENPIRIVFLGREWNCGFWAIYVLTCRFTKGLPWNWIMCFLWYNATWLTVCVFGYFYLIWNCFVLTGHVGVSREKRI